MKNRLHYSNLLTKAILIVAVFCLPANSVGQWAISLGSLENDSASSVQPTADGGYIVVGTTRSFDAVGSDVWLVRLDGFGRVLWQKIYGGEGADSAAAVVVTDGGGFVVAGTTTSFGSDGSDLWVLKLDANGNVGTGYPGTWQKTYGGTDDDSAHDLLKADGGGYVLLASTDSYGMGNDDIWFLKLSETGSIVWEKTHGTTGHEMTPSISSTSDGGYVAVAETQADNGDIWVLKLDSAGNREWEHRYGMQSFVPPDIWNENVEWWPQIHQALDDQYVIAAISQNITGGMPNLWIFKIDFDGSVAWQQYAIIPGDSQTVDIQASDSGSVLAVKWSKGTRGATARVLKLDSTGTFLWGRSYGGDEYNSRDYINSIMPLAGGGFIGAGSSESFDVNAGDFWVLKTDASGAISGCEAMNSFTATFETTSFTAKVITSTMVETTTGVQDTNASALFSDAVKGDGCAPPPQPVLSVGLPKTGQTTCYNNAGDLISCTDSEQDGEIQAGVAWPASRFQDTGTGTILDNLTGLMWLKDANCARTIGHDPDGEGEGMMHWQPALDFVTGINDGTHNISSCASFTSSHRDWRMANVNEIESLYHSGILNPIDWLISQGFVNVGTAAFQSYWSSTTKVSLTNAGTYAWYLRLGGSINGRIESALKGQAHLLTWPVRGGQEDLPDHVYPANIWKTGQNSSWHAGDDGDIQAGVHWPDPRFSDHGDGTVADNLTGLTWLKDANCFGSWTWMAALAIVDGFNSDPGSYSCEEYSANHNDWRPANRKEYMSLTDRSVPNYGGHPSLTEGHPFIEVTGDRYWSSTTYASQNTAYNYGWAYYADGSLITVSKTPWAGRIWPVRGESRGIDPPAKLKNVLFLVIPAAINPSPPAP